MKSVLHHLRVSASCVPPSRCPSTKSSTVSINPTGPRSTPPPLHYQRQLTPTAPLRKNTNIPHSPPPQSIIQDITIHSAAEFSRSYEDSDSGDDADDQSYVSTSIFNMVSSQSTRELLPQTISPTTAHAHQNPHEPPMLMVKTDANRFSTLGATAISVDPAILC